MITNLDHIIIAVENIQEGISNYSKILGLKPIWEGKHHELGTRNALFNFENTYLELLTIDGVGLGADLVKQYLDKNGDGLMGVAYGCNDIKKVHKELMDNNFVCMEPLDGKGINELNTNERTWLNLFLPSEISRGTFTFLIEHKNGFLDPINKKDSSIIHKLDHIVINTSDMDGFINIYKNIFKIRLALDKIIEHWKTRIAFFRLNKTTIEVIDKNESDESIDKLWGLAWEVDSLQKAHDRISSEGIEISPIKNGIKDNTLVCTIKSHTHNVPTLLIEHLN
tara:strand:- start:343 stop:1185 length:843 start_codon:yes stop_codon:yes gene_type:complete